MRVQMWWSNPLTGYSQIWPVDADAGAKAIPANTAFPVNEDRRNELGGQK
jgi:hypothetical protein